MFKTLIRPHINIITLQVSISNKYPLKTLNSKKMTE